MKERVRGGTVQPNSNLCSKSNICTHHFCTYKFMEVFLILPIRQVESIIEIKNILRSVSTKVDF